MLLIGFGHKARQGKNTAAVAMFNAMPLDSHARIYAYADALRAEVTRATTTAGGVMELIQSMNCPKWVLPEMGKQRTLLQWWGTDYRRAQDENYWVSRLQETLEREQPEIALITDVRFPNEAEAIHKLGGKLVKVERTNKPDVFVPSHPSEEALDGFTGWDYSIKAGSIKDCHKQAADIYRQIVEQP